MKIRLAHPGRPRGRSPLASGLRRTLPRRPSVAPTRAPIGGAAPRSTRRSSPPRRCATCSTRPKAAYEAANPGTTLTVSTDSSAALATQIEQGAPADVFLSADTTNPQKLVDGGLADGDVGRLRRQPADGHHADATTPAADRVPGRPRQRRHPGHRRGRRGARSPSTRRSSSTTSPRLEATRPTSPPAYAANIVSQGGQRRRRRDEDRARRGRRRHRLRDGCGGIGRGRGRSRCPTRQRPGELRRRGRRGVAERRSRPRTSSTGSPVPTARRSSPSSGSCRPRHDRRGRRRARRSPPAASARPRARRAWGEHRLLGLAAPRRALPGAAGHHPRRARRRSTARSSDALASRRRSSTALALSLVTTAVEPRPDRRASASRSRFVLARRTFRGQWLVEAIVDLPIVLPPSVAGPGAAARVRSARAARASRCSVLGIEIPFTIARGRARPDVRLGAVLHPLRAGRARRRRSRPRGRRTRRRRHRAPAVPADHGAARRRRPSRPASS